MSSTRELFRNHSLRCTKQREALYEVLRQCKSHPTAEELYRLVHPRVGGLSRATVYNTLDAFCKAGLAKRLPGENGSCRFDADMSEHMHVCVKETSEVRDVPPDLGAMLLSHMHGSVVREIEERMGVTIDGINIQFSGRSNGSSN